METKDTRDVIEAVVCTALCSLAAYAVKWFAERYMNIEERDEINVYINNNPIEVTKLEDNEEEET